MLPEPCRGEFFSRNDRLNRNCVRLLDASGWIAKYRRPDTHFCLLKVPAGEYSVLIAMADGGSGQE